MSWRRSARIAEGEGTVADGTGVDPSRRADVLSIKGVLSAGGVSRAVARGRDEGGGVVVAVYQRVLQADAGCGHAVVFGEDQVLGAVGAVLGLVLAADREIRQQGGERLLGPVDLPPCCPCR